MSNKQNTLIHEKVPLSKFL